MISVFLTTLSIYTHPIGFISCLLIWFSLLVYILIKRSSKPFDKTKVLYFVIPFISLLLSAPQTCAMLFSTRGQQISSTHDSSFFIPSIIATLMLDRHYPLSVGPIGKLFLLFFGFVGFVSVSKKDYQLKLPLIFLFIGLFLLVSKYFMLSPLKVSIFYRLEQYHWRFYPYLKILCVIFIGIGLHFTSDNIMKFSSEKEIINLGTKFVGIMIIFASLALCGRVLTTNRIHHVHSLQTFNTFERKDEIISLWDWLKRNIDPELSRVYMEDTLTTYPSKDSQYRRNHILALTSIATDIKQIGGWNGFTSAFARLYNPGGGQHLFNTDDLNKLSENTVAENLKLLNCKYIVAHSTNVVNFLKNITILEQIATIGSFTVFEYKNMIPAWGFNLKSKEKINLERISSSSYNITANGQAGDLVHLSLAYHSNWKAYHKNVEIPINSSKSFIQIKLPATGNQLIELRYTIDKIAPVVLLFIGIVIFIFFLLYGHNKINRRFEQ